MKADIQRFMIFLSLLTGVALAAPAGAADQSTVSPRAPNEGAGARAPKPGTVDDSAQSRSVISGPPLSLYHGEVQVLDLADVVRIAVGNGEVLRANVVASSQVVLIGQNAGTTSLRVWTRNGTQFTYEVNVRSFDVSQILRDVQELLAGEPGISARQVDGHVLIEGDYSGARTASRLEALLKIYPQIVSTVPIRKEAPPVSMDRMVYMDVRVVEIEKKTLRRLGVNWATQANGPAVGVNLRTSKNWSLPTNGGFFGIASNLTSMLDVLEQAGESWTLAEPTVSCKSGGAAKFTVGGEIPVPVAAGLGTSTVIYKEYGVILEFKPVADDKGNVSSSIVAEVSQPDATFSNISNNGLVAFQKTRTETEVTLRENETLVISGLLKNDGNKAANGIPGAKDIPVLGNLFKSKQFQNDRTELVVMVTPRSVAVGQQANAASIGRADEMQAHVTPTINVINGKLAE
ncbi:MAG TPA: pilus assembly protein N-terminal domain-containing protein [Steroidobacteraceae bacterium]|nr:pilus assembly protein N-terminal domain-containing protein [Steroidobacteraceae bacterium]